MLCLSLVFGRQTASSIKALLQHSDRVSCPGHVKRLHSFNLLTLASIDLSSMKLRQRHGTHSTAGCYSCTCDQHISLGLRCGDEVTPHACVHPKESNIVGLEELFESRESVPCRPRWNAIKPCRLCWAKCTSSAFIVYVVGMFLEAMLLQRRECSRTRVSLVSFQPLSSLLPKILVDMCFAAYFAG